jgi:hypothetical protein
MAGLVVRNDRADGEQDREQADTACGEAHDETPWR